MLRVAEVPPSTYFESEKTNSSGKTKAIQPCKDTHTLPSNTYARTHRYKYRGRRFDNMVVMFRLLGNAITWKPCE